MRLCAVAALLAAILAVVMLERQRIGVSVEHLSLASSPVSLWRPGDGGTGPLVIVAHGYAGSRQMMQPVAIALARSGFVVAAFDFLGHGRNARPMTGDPTALEGATERLVQQTAAVIEAARRLPGVTPPVSLVGHSMATDIVIRAAARRDDVAAVVAVSMYSEAVSPDAPQTLLIVSGAREGRLRDVALDRLRQLDAAASEEETVIRGDVRRRAVAAPLVGHVGVLYSPSMLAETRAWIAEATGHHVNARLPWVGPSLLLLLAALVALAWPLSGLLGACHPALRRNKSRSAILPLAAPILPALIAAVITPPGAFGLSAFGALAVFLGIWGGVQLALLWRRGDRPAPVQLPGLLLLLVWGLALFAPALDRYGAAFLPTGPRLPVMALLIAGTLPYCVADAHLARGLTWWPRLAARILPLLTLLVAMLLVPRLGVAFTVLPVMVLFWCVYGLAGRWVAARCGPTTAGAALGIILAWAIAASTPLIGA